jgi:hypothetical protein
MAPFKIYNEQEGNWVKSWLNKQIVDGRFYGLRPDAAHLLSGLEEVRSFVDRYVTDIEDRQRLQKALSARRARDTAKKSSQYVGKVTTELEIEARQILLAVAESRGVTTSELIKATFASEHLKLATIR